MFIKTKISYIFLRFFILFFLNAAVYSSFYTDNPLIPVDKKCEVRAGTINSVLPFSVYYYSNITGNVTKTSITYYDDSGKHTINKPVFPFTKVLYLNEVDTSLTYATSTSNPGGVIAVVCKVNSAGYSSEERDSCYK